MPLDIFPIMLWAFGVVATLAYTWIQDRRETRKWHEAAIERDEIAAECKALRARLDAACDAVTRLATFVQKQAPDAWAKANAEDSDDA